MRQQIFLRLALVLICLAASCWGRAEHRKDKRSSLLGRRSIYDYDYDYAAIAPKMSSLQQQRSNPNPTTTQRPLVRYWQNLMRNVRFSMPTLPWNITNPLTNLFHAGVSNVLETPPVIIQQQYVTDSKNGKLKSSHKQRKSPSVHKKKRKNVHQKTHEEDYEVQRQQQSQEAYLPQEPYSSYVDPPAEPMYFYYPNAEQYLQLQKLRNRGHYMQDNYYYDKDNYYDEENETHDEEADFVTAMPLVDDLAEEYNDVADNAVASAESESSERNVYADDVTGEEDTNDDISQQSNAKSAETLRTLIGNYMGDEHANRLRLPATQKHHHSSSRNTVTTEPQNNYEYYVLQPYKLRSV